MSKQLILLSGVESVGKLKRLSAVRKAWLAAAIDFEASIQIVKRNRGTPFALVIKLSSVTPELTYQMRRLTGLGSISTQHFRRLSSKYLTTVFEYNVTSNGAYEILQAIFPYLVSKRDQALIGIEFQRERNKHIWHTPEVRIKEQELYEKLKRLHHKHVPSESASKR